MCTSFDSEDPEGLECLSDLICRPSGWLILTVFFLVAVPMAAAIGLYHAVRRALRLSQ